MTSYSLLPSFPPFLVVLTPFLLPAVPAPCRACSLLTPCLLPAYSRPTPSILSAYSLPADCLLRTAQGAEQNQKALAFFLISAMAETEPELFSQQANSLLQVNDRMCTKSQRH